MGRKGVSKRKPKKDNSSANANSGATTTRSDRSLVASLVSNTAAPLDRGGGKPSGGANKKRKNGK